MNEIALCQCGCGEPAPLAPHTITSKGLRKGDPYRFKRGHSSRVDHPNKPKPRPEFPWETRPLCACGCGEKVPLAWVTHVGRGWRLGYPLLYCSYHRPPKLDRYEVTDTGYETPCWLWSGHKTKDGYGLIVVRGKLRTAHRVAYEKHIGRPLTTKQHLHHLCHQRNCINPDHLEQTTLESHSRLHHSKLTPEDVLAIRASTEGCDPVAARYGIGRSTVKRIRNRKVWKDI